MKRMSNGSVMMQLSPKYRDMYTMNTNLNPDYVRAVRDNLKYYGTRIARAIRRGNAEMAVSLTVEAGSLKRSLLRNIDTADKIVYDRSGDAVYFWSTKEQTLYTLD